MDNVRRVVTQGTTVDGKPSPGLSSLEAPRTLAELLTAARPARRTGLQPWRCADLRGQVAPIPGHQSVAPRLQNCRTCPPTTSSSAADATAARRFYYTPHFEALLLEMPRVLAAFDSHWGDARTNLTTYLQLQLQMDRDDDKADGVLNGPTTEAWFDHLVPATWSSSEFASSAVGLTASRPARRPRESRPTCRPRVQVQLRDGTRVAPDYTVVAVDAPGAERITVALRSAGTGGTVAELNGFHYLGPPAQRPASARGGPPRSGGRDPYALDQMGRVPWDRLPMLAGIQYFFDTEFQLLRGHMYYSGTEWGLSSISQSGM